MIDAGNDSVFSVWKSYVCFLSTFQVCGKNSGRKIERKDRLQRKQQPHKKLEEQLDIRFTAAGRVIWAVEVSFTDGTIKCRVAFLSEREAAHSDVN